MVETSDDWIVQRTGIKERRITDKNIFASHLAIEAVKDLKAKVNFDTKILIIL